MGITFKYIADGVLESSGLGNCQHCNRDGVTSFAYDGEIVDPALAANPSLAESEKTIFAACLDCIQGGNIRKPIGVIRRITEIIQRCDCEVVPLVARYHQIPSIPLLLQDDDWPICCGDWCEYYGTLAQKDESINVSPEHRLWRFGPTDHGCDSSAFADVPEDADMLTDTSLFRCLNCGGAYCIFQPT